MWTNHELRPNQLSAAREAAGNNTLTLYRDGPANNDNGLSYNWRVSILRILQTNSLKTIGKAPCKGRVILGERDS